jgi:hypothetical protein
VVAAFDAQAINLAKTVAPALVDLALGWSVPFMDVMRRGKQQNKSSKGSNNLYQPQEDQPQEEKKG